MKSNFYHLRRFFTEFALHLVMNISLIGRTLFLLTNIVIALYAIMYNWYDYKTLAANYCGDLSSFYHESSWKTDYFKPSTKSFGQIYLIVLFLLMLITSVFFWRKSSCTTFYFPKSMIKSDYGMIASFSVGLWWFFEMKAPYAYDEVFSTYHFAEVSPWIAWSYYPLPNNQILFNVINAFLFKLTGFDALIIGRLLSCIFFMLSSIVIYKFTSIITQNRHLRLLITLLCIISLPTLGFATQARGYCLMTLAVLCASFTLLNGLRKYLVLYSLSIWVGMCIMPSFLYFWFGFSLATVWLYYREKQLISAWIRHSWMTLLMVLAFYTPIITFSGWQSVLMNKYVKPNNDLLSSFISSLPSYWQGLSNEWFMTESYGSIGALCLGIMMISLYNHNEKFKQLAKILFSLLLGTFLIIVLMQKIPFYRNLSPFAPLLWLGIGAVLFSLASKFGKFGQYSLVLTTTCILVWKISAFSKTFPNNLYYYDVVGTYNQQLDCIKSQNKDQCIVIDDDAFYISAFIKTAHNMIPNNSISGCLLIKPSEKVGGDSTSVVYRCGGYSWLQSN